MRYLCSAVQISLYEDALNVVSEVLLVAGLSFTLSLNLLLLENILHFWLLSNNILGVGIECEHEHEFSTYPACSIPNDKLLEWHQLRNMAWNLPNAFKPRPAMPFAARRSPKKGKASSYRKPQNGWHSWLCDPGTFELGPFQSVELILFQRFSNFFTFILRSPFLLPQKANYGKGEFFQLQIWMRQRRFSAWGIQTGPLAAL